MMEDSVERFYAELAADYHLLYADWDRSVSRQADVLHRIIASRFATWPLSLLDCSCGIGTQAIGLAERGYRVHGTDLSPAMVELAKQEAARRGVSLELGVADVRTLADQVSGPFDVVISCDNALPHLLADEDLLLATRNMRHLLHDKGWVLISIRDYNLMTTQRPGSDGFRVMDGPEGRRIAFQVWDWSDDGRSYLVHQFLLRQTGSSWHTNHYHTRYRALLRSELGNILNASGFRNAEWLFPEVTGYHQPIVLAQR